MAISKAFTTVTPLSKLVALIMFVGFPFLGFYLGIQFQKSITPQFPTLQYEVPQKVTNQMNVTPPLTCTPRPKCLDSVPRCLIATTADMCPPAGDQKMLRGAKN